MTMESDSTEAAPSLLTLPYEILLKVLRSQDGQLTHDDFKALRLTCRHLSYGPTIACLFHTVGISRLQRDIDNFIAIASHPRLAEHVRVIVWHELRSRRQAMDWEPAGDTTETSCLHAFEQDICRTLKTQVTKISWDKALVPSTDDPLRMLLCSPVPNCPLPQLFQAARAMPGVHTLISKPMHKDRRLTPNRDTTSYPLTAQALDGIYFFPCDGSSPWSNFGFFAFILPLIAQRPAERPITRLCFSDENLVSSLVRMQPSLHRDSFHYLTSLDFCISGADIAAGNNGPRELLKLGECIRAATGLRYLHICSENGVPYTTREDMIDVILIGRLQAVPELNLPAVEPEDPDFKWAYLQELRLSGCTFPPQTLGDFMRRQAHSLKKVQLYDCQFAAKDLRSITKKNTSPETLRLESFVVLISEAGDTAPGFVEKSPPELSEDDDALCDPILLPYCVGEKQLVDFLNGSFASLPAGDWSRLAAELDGVQPRQLIYTHAPIFDAVTSFTGLVCDTRARCEIARELYNFEEIKALDFDNGDIRDHEGYSFQPGTHYHPREHSDGRYPRLWKDNLQEHSVDGDDEDEDTEFKPFDYAVGDADGLSVDFDDGLRWVVARDPEGVVYYWREKDDADVDTPDDSSPFFQYTSPKYKTEVWRLTHHSGETAVGRDPLEYWDDWDGEEAGDFAEASPLGYTMRAFINHTRSRKEPKFRCSKEHIEARGGIRYDSEGHDYGDVLQEIEIFEGFVNRFDWYESQLAGWRLGPYGPEDEVRDACFM